MLKVYTGHTKPALLGILKSWGIVGVSQYKRRRLLAIYLEYITTHKPHLQALPVNRN